MSFKNYSNFSLIEYFNGYISLSKQINISNNKYNEEISALIFEGSNSSIDLVKIQALTLGLITEKNDETSD